VGTPVTRRELGLVAAAVLLATALVYGRQVAGGGLYWDDWQNVANVHFAREPGLFGALDQATGRPVFGYRPVLTGLLVVQYHALASHVHALLALAALYGATTAFALFLLLRTLGLAMREALVPAALLLVFPWCDSTRVWNTASFDTLAVTLYLLGLMVAVRALRTPPGGRRRLALTAGSLALYLAAAWTYEIVAIAVACSVALYLLVAPRRDALRRFALDAVVVGVALAVVAAGTTRTPLGLSDQLKHALTLAEQSFSLLARALVPVGDVPGIVGAVLLAGVAGAALAARRKRPELRPWLAAAGLGGLCVAAGYVLFVPAGRYYEPLAPGSTNRMNVLAAVGYAVLVYALVRLASALVAGRRAPVVAAVLLAAIGTGYVVRVLGDEGDWRRSAEIQEQVLDTVRSTLPRPPRGATIYSFEAPAAAAPGVPVFSLPFDLNAAVRLRYDDPSLRAYPIRGFDVIRCLPGRLEPAGGSYGPAHGARYGAAWFVAVRRRAAVRIDSSAECRRWAALLSAT
jgi:hypothetical protein